MHFPPTQKRERGLRDLPSATQLKAEAGPPSSNARPLSTKPRYWESPNASIFNVIFIRVHGVLEGPRRKNVKTCSFDNTACKTPRELENDGWMLLPFGSLYVGRAWSTHRNQTLLWRNTEVKQSDNLRANKAKGFANAVTASTQFREEKTY